LVTGYSWYDNTPPGSPAISQPVLHTRAAGVGTYADPITVAVGHSIINGRDVADWAAGSMFYIPNLHRYFIVEDTCGDGPSPQDGPCHTGFPGDASTWLDVWIDGRTGSQAATRSCANAITGVRTVIRNPGPRYPAESRPIFAGSCTPQFGDNP
jgi:hypothetical protein